MPLLFWALLLLLLSYSTTAAFHHLLGTQGRQRRSLLSLIPISRYRDEIQFLDQPREGDSISNEGLYENDYILGIVEDKDLPDTARFVINAFGADVISLSQDMNTLERALMAPTVGLLNSYSGLVAYAEVFTGLQSRTKDRVDITAPKLQGKSDEEQIKQSESSSLILILAKPKPASDWQVDIVASVELRLQVTDAKIPFSYPWLDRLERKLASLLLTKSDNYSNKKLQPYLSNLCVDESHRRKNLGRSLVRCVEDIAKTSWGYNKMYLHVDKENAAAMKLYQREGYKPVKGSRWQPFWAGDLSNIDYFVKKL